MPNESLAEHQTWRWLWTQAAQQIIAAISLPEGFERASIGYGWGVRRCCDSAALLLLHPTGTERAQGDLTLTIVNHSTMVIAREGRAYPEYIALAEQLVADAVATLTSESFVGAGRS